MEEKKFKFFSRENIKILEDESRQQTKEWDRISALPYETNKVNPEEIHFVRDAFQSLQRYAQEVVDEVRAQPSEQKIARYRQGLDFMIKGLDELSWAAKFSTSIDGDVEKYSDEDSLYYMTTSGMTIRLKKAMLANGLNEVVRSPKEKCLFRDAKTGIFRIQPKIGDDVEEFSSPEFIEAVKGNADIIRSSLKLFKDAQGNYVGARSRGTRHPGHMVNRIYFSKF